MNLISNIRINPNKVTLYGLILLFLMFSPRFLSAQGIQKCRVIILTDVENEPDDSEWLAQNIQQGHDPLGAVYPDVAYGMEGDTHTFLSLIPNGLNNYEHPDWAGWGGREPEPQAIWTNAADKFPALGHPDQITVKSGEGFVLDASGTSDPDGDNLSYFWFQYTEVGSYKKPVRFDQAEDLYRVPYIKAPVVDKPETTHFILKVTDKGNPPLTRYKSVIVNILP